MYTLIILILAILLVVGLLINWSTLPTLGTGLYVIGIIVPLACTIVFSLYVVGVAVVHWIQEKFGNRGE